MLQLNTLVRFIHSHSPARLSKFKKILARRPKSVPTPVIYYKIVERSIAKRKKYFFVELCYLSNYYEQLRRMTRIRRGKTQCMMSIDYYLSNYKFVFFAGLQD